MFYTEDTTTQQNTDSDDDTLLILDGTASLDYIEQKPDHIEHTTVIEKIAQYFKASHQ